jgi:hypothetical protein
MILLQCRQSGTIGGGARHAGPSGGSRIIADPPEPLDRGARVADSEQIAEGRQESRGKSA